MNIKCHLCGKEIESGVFNHLAHTEVCVPDKAIIKENLKKISKQKLEVTLPMTGEAGQKLFHTALEKEAKKFLAEDSTTKWLSFEEWKAQEEWLRNHPLNRGI
tara:strand:+ start:12534 stop:12842 length:309 start_codon:yes stop_codon:yes gene_type:complete